jgi:prepilin signal peptidase PulO-like enzyme (type II secretory pathway)
MVNVFPEPVNVVVKPLLKIYKYKGPDRLCDLQYHQLHFAQSTFAAALAVTVIVLILEQYTHLVIQYLLYYPLF